MRRLSRIAPRYLAGLGVTREVVFPRGRRTLFLRNPRSPSLYFNLGGYRRGRVRAVFSWWSSKNGPGIFIVNGLLRSRLPFKFQTSFRISCLDVQTTNPKSIHDADYDINKE